MRAVLLLALVSMALRAEAQSPLRSVADALGGTERIDAVETIQTQITTRARLAGRTVEVRSTVSMRLPDAGRWDAVFGTGTRSVIVRADSVIAVGGTARISDADALLARQSLWLDPVVLAARRGEVRAVRLGPELLRLTIPDFPEPVLLRLDDERRPALLTTFRQRASDGVSQRGDGRREYLEVRYSDYREVDGLAVAISHRPGRRWGRDGDVHGPVGAVGG